MGIQSLPPNAGTSRIKKRIRDTERLLKKPGLSATKKTEAERALASFKVDLTAAQQRKVEIKNAKKYHMVKFIEKRKAFRALKKPEAGDEQLAVWYYITMYPKGKKYKALYANSDSQNNEMHEDDPKEAKESSVHWFMREIQAKMKSGELATGKAAIEDILKNNTSL